MNWFFFNSKIDWQIKLQLEVLQTNYNLKTLKAKKALKYNPGILKFTAQTNTVSRKVAIATCDLPTLVVKQTRLICNPSLKNYVRGLDLLTIQKEKKKVRMKKTINPTATTAGTIKNLSTQ